MASRVEIFDAEVPALTPISAPLVTPLPFEEGQLDRLEILIPPGSNGLMGFGLLHSGASVFPREDDRWIVADGEVIAWDLEDVPTAGRWAVRQYNNDVNPHTIYLRFLVSEIWRRGVVALASQAIAQPNQPAPATEDTRTPAEIMAMA